MINLLPFGSARLVGPATFLGNKPSSSHFSPSQVYKSSIHADTVTFSGRKLQQGGLKALQNRLKQLPDGEAVSVYFSLQEALKEKAPEQAFVLKPTGKALPKAVEAKEVGMIAFFKRDPKTGELGFNNMWPGSEMKLVRPDNNPITNNSVIGLDFGSYIRLEPGETLLFLLNEPQFALSITPKMALGRNAPQSLADLQTALTQLPTREALSVFWEGTPLEKLQEAWKNGTPCFVLKQAPDVDNILRPTGPIAIFSRTRKGLTFANKQYASSNPFGAPDIDGRKIHGSQARLLKPGQTLCLFQTTETTYGFQITNEICKPTKSNPKKGK